MKRSFLFFGVLLGLLPLAAARAQMMAIPDQAYISGVAGHAQAYSLSCEARSAADWAAYWGVYIDETEFLNRLPRSDNPNEGFVGNPDDPWGYIPPSSYGVHADPVANLLRAYGLDAHADVGVSWDEVRAEVASGRPVIVWVIGSIWSGTPKEYETNDGRTVTVANNEHTMILIGYDESRIHLVDALTGYTVTHPLENFLTSWAVLGNMAIVGEGSGAETVDEDEEAAARGDSYIVQPGDTLNKVAARFDLYWPDLAAWNDISYPYIIYPGQDLFLSGEPSEPAPEPPAETEEQTYTVQIGDNIIDVAGEFGVDWVQLAWFNGVMPPFILNSGTVLELPTADEDIARPEVPEVYTAARSESLLAIAAYYGLDWLSVAGMNGLSYPFIIAPGQTIQLQ
ncbi:MAG: LysM peptidoglycan-binding domain-containing protein [Anaerolineales bacterium]